MNFSRKMLLMIILNVAKNQVSLCMMYLEDTLCAFFCGGGRRIDPPSRFMVNFIIFSFFSVAVRENSKCFSHTF